MDWKFSLATKIEIQVHACKNNNKVDRQTHGGIYISGMHTMQ